MIVLVKAVNFPLPELKSYIERLFEQPNAIEYKVKFNKDTCTIYTNRQGYELIKIMQAHLKQENKVIVVTTEEI